MAFIRKFPSSKNFYGGFTLPNGTRVQKTTKTPNRREALEIATAWEKVARKKMTEAQCRKVMSDIHESIHGVPLAYSTYRAYAAEWIKAKEGTVTKASFGQYTSALTRFTAFLGQKADEDIGYLRPQDVQEFRDSIAQQSSNRTANNILKILKTFLKSAWKDNFLSENLGEKVNTLKNAESDRRGFSAPEVIRLLEVAGKESEWFGMILFGAFTGLRLKDIGLLTWEQIDRTNWTLSVRTRKTQRQVNSHLSRRLQSWIAESNPEGAKTGPIFRSAFDSINASGKTNHLSQDFYDTILVPAGFAPEKPQDKKAHAKGRTAKRVTNPQTFHSLRYTATSLLKQSGVSEAVAMDIVGHDSAAMSRHYTRIDSATLKKATDSMDTYFDQTISQ